MLKRTLMAAACLMACLSAPAQTASPETAPSLVGRLDVNSIIRITEKAGKFADRIEPGSSGKLVFATIGLTVNPQVVDYDLSKPFSLLLFSDPSDKANPWGVCAILSKRREKLPPLVKIFGNDLRVKDLGDGRAALATSERLLNSLGDETLKPKAVEGQSVPDIALSLVPEAVLKGVSLSDVFLKQAVDASKGKPLDDLEGMKEARIKLQRFELVAKQLSELSLSISFAEEPAASLKVAFKAKEGSALEAFIKSQKGAAPNPEAFVLSGADCFGSAAIVASPVLIESLSSMYNEIAIETSLDEKSMRYADAIAELAKAATGEVSFCAGSRQGLPLTVVEARFAPESRAVVEKAVAANAKGRTDTPDLWLLRDWSSGASMYCLLEKDRAKLLFGSCDEDDAAELLAKGRLLKAEPLPKELLAYVAKALKPEEAFLEDAKSSRAFLTVYAKGSSLEAKLDVTPDDLGALQPISIKPPSKRNAGRQP